MKLISKINGKIYPYNEYLAKNPNLEVYFEPQILEDVVVPEDPTEIEIVPTDSIGEIVGEYKKGKKIGKRK